MKPVVVAALLIIAVSGENATGRAQPSNLFGLKAGLNIATTNENNSSPLIGFVGGGFLTVALTDILALQPELFFTMKGRNDRRDSS